MSKSTCKVCRHKDRTFLERKYFAGTLTLNDIAKKVGCSVSHIHKHIHEHIKVGADCREQKAEGNDLLPSTNITPLNPPLQSGATHVQTTQTTDFDIDIEQRLKQNILRFGRRIQELEMRDDLDDLKKFDLILRIETEERKYLEAVAKIFDVVQKQKEIDGTLTKLTIVIKDGDVSEVVTG